jgi:hypothetical protein
MTLHASASARKSNLQKIGPAFVVMADGSLYKIDRLLATGKKNAKMAKNGEEFLTLGSTLAPHKQSGLGTLCTFASPDCIKLCLNISGHSMAPYAERTIFPARVARARLYFQDRPLFLAMLRQELTLAVKLAKRTNRRVIARLNVLSDIDWARVHPDIIRDFPSIVFYGYTKVPSAMRRFADGAYPKNYYLTFSRSEKNEATAIDFLKRACNITVVFNKKYSTSGKHPLPATWNGFPVIDGDETDLRFLDPQGVVVGLRAKGLARRPENQANGFVVRV